MTELIRQWLTGIACTSLIACIALSLSPSGRAKTAVRLVSGLLVLIAFVKPVIEFDSGSLSELIVSYKASAGEYTKRFEEENDRMLKAIIEEDAATYILDKAGELGVIDCEVSVLAKREDDEHYPYPSEVWVSAAASEAQRASLAEYIESELGIRSDRQHWRMKNGY